MSGNSWANMGQECIKCHINVYPHKQVQQPVLLYWQHAALQPSGEMAFVSTDPGIWFALLHIEPTVFQMASLK